ncbi:MAG: hypothetical protein H7138_14575 [Myxococcales bacterium]|nr:hypothetical protein [Myxococcales bacterium]
MRALLGVIVDIILLRRGPEHVPASPALLAVVIAVYAAAVAITASLFGPSEQRWAIELVVAITATLVFYQLALTFAKKRERFTQTMTAIFAVRAIFTPLLIPMMGALLAAMKGGQPAPSMLALLLLAGMIWNFVIDVRIVRTAFEWPTPGAVMMVIAQQLVMLAIFIMLVGTPPTPPA